MVVRILKNELESVIKKYGIYSIQAYNVSLRIAIELDNIYHKNTIESYYNESYHALNEYIKKYDITPSEVKWNKYAIENKYLSSQTIGYIYGKGFNKLCKEIKKELRNFS